MFGNSSTASVVSHHVRASAEIGAANDVPVLRGLPNGLAGMTQGLRWPVPAGHWVRVRRGSRPSCRVKRASGLGAFPCPSRARDRRPGCGCHSDTVTSRAACFGTRWGRPAFHLVGRARLFGAASDAHRTRLCHSRSAGEQKRSSCASLAGFPLACDRSRPSRARHASEQRIGGVRGCAFTRWVCLVVAVAVVKVVGEIAVFACVPLASSPPIRYSSDGRAPARAPVVWHRRARARRCVCVCACGRSGRGAGGRMDAL